MPRRGKPGLAVSAPSLRPGHTVRPDAAAIAMMELFGLSQSAVRILQARKEKYQAMFLLSLCLAVTAEALPHDKAFPDLATR